MNRVIVMGDLYRGRADVGPNTSRIQRVLEEPLSALGFSVLRYTGTLRGDWVEHYNAAPTPKLLEALREFRNDLVLCFETPPVMARAFAALGVDYIDLNIHPIRFGPDLLLGMRAAAPYKQKAIDFHAADVSRIVEMYRAIASAARPVQIPPELRGAPVFFAQCEGDRTLISKGSFCSWRWARGAVKAFAAGGPWFVQPHPHGADNGFVRGAVKAGATLLRGVNTYDLLASGIPFRPFTLASSVHFEAEAFGYKSRPLLSLHHFGTPILHDFRRSSFWAHVLDRPAAGMYEPDFEPGFLRREFGIAWSFREPVKW